MGISVFILKIEINISDIFIFYDYYFNNSSFIGVGLISASFIILFKQGIL